MKTISKILRILGNYVKLIQLSLEKLNWYHKLSKFLIPILLVSASLLSIIYIPRILTPTALFMFKHHYIIEEKDSAWLASEKEKLAITAKQLDKQLATSIPKTPYLIINSTQNKFFLYKGNRMIREGRCSTGSYLQLEKGDSQKWLFKTPKGEFKIRNKKTDPVWKKPDWAFVEEGLAIPSPNHPSRYEYGVLGDYALSLGDGYMIHGTIWQRYLGLPVTHGCVRLNDEDLEAVYKTLFVGSKVYIF